MGFERGNRPPAANRAEETRGGCVVASWKAVPRKTGKTMVRFCPRVSVVLGDVIDIGESAWWFAAAGLISRLRD